MVALSKFQILAKAENKSENEKAGDFRFAEVTKIFSMIIKNVYYELYFNV